MSLYHKYRPADFESMVGNAATIESLKGELAKPEDKRAHSYLLTGPSGCGKTTLARMMARMLGADDLSIREVNTADNRGIDTAREMIEQTRYASPTGKPIAYIIDECHQTSKDWQNAMLKPLEDTPRHVYFFLCTTDPQKLLRAIHTRCKQVMVESLTSTDLYRLVRKVAKAEGMEVDKEILEAIAENAMGSPRDALNKLDAIVGLTDPEEMKIVIAKGSESEAQTIDLCRALLKDNPSWGNLSAILEGLKDTDAEQTRRAVMGYMSSTLLKSGKHRAAVVMECFNESTFASGFPGLVLMTYLASHSE